MAVLSSPGGAVVGGFAVGIIENLSGTYIPGVGGELKLTIALLIIISVLVVKPSGLFGVRYAQRVSAMTDLNEAVSNFNDVPGANDIAVDRKRMTTIVISLCILAAAVAMPFALSSFYIFQLTMILIYAIAIMGLNLLTGFNGQFSLGHAAFYAIGAYTAAIMMEKFGISYVWTLPVAAIICFIFGFLFGLPALRLEGIYLALATFALFCRDPADPEVLAVRGMDRRRPGPRDNEAECAGGITADIGSMALYLHAPRHRSHATFWPRT